MEEFVKELCDLLKIDPIPLIKEDGKYFGENKRKFVTYKMNEDQCIHYIYKENYKKHDYIEMARNVRYAWQDRTDHDFYFGHIPDPSTITLHQYNMLDSTIDAIAFSNVVMKKIFDMNVSTDYEEDAEAQEKYEGRVEELKKELGL